MKVLVTGALGQLGYELIRAAPGDVEIFGLSRAQCDVGDLQAIRTCFQHFLPRTVINCAAFTAVDRAQDSPSEAYAANAIGAENVARAASEIGARVVHLSTDYVFDGESRIPYSPDMPARPINVYGASKLEGENRVRAVSKESLIIRTGWLYSTTGKNFVRTILDAMRRTRAVRVVNDQFGGPSAAGEIAQAIWTSLRIPSIRGVQHWANAGEASWWEFACAIEELSLERRLILQRVPIEPIATADYPTTARRPRYSVLDTTEFSRAIGLAPTPWREALAKTLDGMVENRS